MDPITIAGLVTSGAGLLSSMFSKSEAEKKQERINQQLKYLAQLKQKALLTGTAAIQNQTEGGALSARAGAAERAASLGRGGDTEAFTVPAESRVRNAGGEALRGFLGDTQRQFGQAEMGLMSEGVNMPEEPNAGDYLMPIGGAMMKYGLMKDKVPEVLPTTTVPNVANVASPTPPASATDWSTQGTFNENGPSWENAGPGETFYHAPKPVRPQGQLADTYMSPGLKGRARLYGLF